MGTASLSSSRRESPGSAPGGGQPRRRRLRLNLISGGSVGIFLMALFLGVAVFAPLLSPFDPITQDLTGRLRPPLWVDTRGAMHILGTDDLGRDLLSRIIHGSRVSLVVAIAVVPLSAGLGIFLGVSAGFLRGAYENVVMRLLDVQLALPFMLLALAVLVVIGPSFGNIVLLLGLTSWTSYARLLRAETLSLRERDFVLAAQAVGASTWRIMFRHILPNTINTIIVLATLQLPVIIITEASLSFLGLGIQPPAPSWGGMLSKGREYLLNQWWVPFFPGLCITLVALGGNLFGDWLSDTLDPYRRGRRG